MVDLQDVMLPMIGRKMPLFIEDMAKWENYLQKLIHESRFLVIGGAGTIGS